MAPDHNPPPPREVVLPPLKAPAFAEPEKAQGGNWMWLVAAIVLAGLGLGVLTGSIHISGLTGSREALNLRATDSNGAVRIEWDPTAEPIVEATGGALLVLDGDKKVETPLSRQRLEEGNMVYRRQSSDVEIRLRVDGSGKQPVQEMALLVGLPAVSTPAPQQYAADRPKPVKPRPAAAKKRAVVSAHARKLEPQSKADPPRRSWVQRMRLKKLNPVAAWRRIRKTDETSTAR
jgi:hypothetical protein